MDTVSLGLSYRTSDAIVIQLGYQKDGLRFGYAFDLILSDIRTQSAGSHEIMLIYTLSNFLGKSESDSE